MTQRLVIEGEAEVRYEDGDHALIVDVNDGINECRQFIRIQSWCECGTLEHHPQWLMRASNKKFRVTIEEVD